MKDIITYNLEDINKVIEILDSKLTITGLKNMEGITNIYALLKDKGEIRTVDDNIPFESTDTTATEEPVVARELFNAATDTLTDEPVPGESTENIASELNKKPTVCECEPAEHVECEVVD